MSVVETADIAGFWRVLTPEGKKQKFVHVEKVEELGSHRATFWPSTSTRDSFPINVNENKERKLELNEWFLKSSDSSTLVWQKPKKNDATEQITHFEERFKIASWQRVNFWKKEDIIGKYYVDKTAIPILITEDENNELAAQLSDGMDYPISFHDFYISSAGKTAILLEKTDRGSIKLNWKSNDPESKEEEKAEDAPWQKHEVKVDDIVTLVGDKNKIHNATVLEKNKGILRLHYIEFEEEYDITLPESSLRIAKELPEGMEIGDTLTKADNLFLYPREETQVATDNTTSHLMEPPTPINLNTDEPFVPIDEPEETEDVFNTSTVDEFFEECDKTQAPKSPEVLILEGYQDWKKRKSEYEVVEEKKEEIEEIKEKEVEKPEEEKEVEKTEEEKEVEKTEEEEGNFGPLNFAKNETYRVEKIEEVEKLKEEEEEEKQNEEDTSDELDDIDYEAKRRKSFYMYDLFERIHTGNRNINRVSAKFIRKSLSFPDSWYKEEGKEKIIEKKPNKKRKASGVATRSSKRLRRN